MKKLYAVSLDMTVYVVADDAADAECLVSEDSEIIAEELHNAYVHAREVKDEEDVDPEILGALPWGAESNDPLRDEPIKVWLQKIKENVS